MSALKLFVPLAIVCVGAAWAMPTLGFTGLALSIALVAVALLCVACAVPALPRSTSKED